MLKSESLPSGFVYVEKGSSIFYHYIKSSNQPLDSPKLLGTIIITHKLEVQMFYFFCSTTKIFLQSLIVFSQHYKDHYRVLNLLFCLQICLWLVIWFHCKHLHCIGDIASGTLRNSMHTWWTTTWEYGVMKESNIVLMFFALKTDNRICNL